MNNCLEALYKAYSKLETFLYTHEKKLDEKTRIDLKELFDNKDKQIELIRKYYTICCVCKKNNPFDNKIDRCDYKTPYDMFAECNGCKKLVHKSSNCCIKIYSTRGDKFYCDNKKCINKLIEIATK